MEKYSEYRVDFASFGDERPLGVSGVLRCRNSADYLEACIDSSIDALDELVAVYHDCFDETGDILERKRLQYPGKLKVYRYAPFVYSPHLDEDGWAEVRNLSPVSVHLLSGYSNFALSKTTYRYLLKIDSDQVYFTGKLKRLCDAYRSEREVEVGLWECTAFNLFRTYLYAFFREEMQPYRWMERVAVWSYPFYLSYVEKMVIRKKIAVALSGINLYTEGEEWLVGLGDPSQPVLPPFNGVGDTFVFPMEAGARYERKLQEQDRKGRRYRVIECMDFCATLWYGGFYWFHLRAVMQEKEAYYRRLYRMLPCRFVPLDSLKQHSYRSFAEKYRPFFGVASMESMFSYFHTAERKRIPWKLADRLLKTYHICRQRRAAKQTCMQTRDFYIEFHEELDRALQSFVDGRLREDPGAFRILGHPVEIPLITYLFYQLTGERAAYNASRLQGKTISESLERIASYLAHFAWDAPEPLPLPASDYRQHEWYGLLSPFRGQLAFYLYNYRQLRYLAPLIRHLDTPAVLLCDFDVPDEADELDLPPCVTAVPFQFATGKVTGAGNLAANFPRLYCYAYTLDLLVRLLAPRCIVCLEGCHYEEQLWAVVARTYRIPSVCIQQGWPSMMRTGFRRLPFDHFFTWGQRFNACWQRYNPFPHFAGLGYMYEAEGVEVAEGRDAVSFFLQGPFYLSDEAYQEEFVDLIRQQALAFPSVPFLVREHPEYKLWETGCASLETLPNITFVSDRPLADVFRRSQVVVSHFSSSLMECLVHGAIPLVYDPTARSRYYPDIEAEKLGRIATTPAEFRACLADIRENCGQFRRQIGEVLPGWFARTAQDTLEAMKKYLLALPVPGMD